ncbi:MAG: DUF721 domain-containing protein [Treponema sp.]|jgi:hypothetical protein|nr:DUF721 domain-containing protein [Treponema sp.]
MKKAGDLLSFFFDEQMLNTAQEYSELFASWTFMVEKHNIAAAATHSQIVELERHVIFIEADHPGWIQILQTKQRQLLDEFQRCFPELTITGISFRLSRDPRLMKTTPVMKTLPNAEPGPKEITPEKTQAEEQYPAEIYEKIQDADFKQALKRLERSIISRNNAKREP